MRLPQDKQRAHALTLQIRGDKLVSFCRKCGKASSKHRLLLKSNFFKIIIDDGSHILTEMISSLKFFFKYVEKGGFFIIEDFNAPIYFKSLNDSFDNELLMKDIFEKIKKKKIF